MTYYIKKIRARLYMCRVRGSKVIGTGGSADLAIRDYKVQTKRRSKKVSSQSGSAAAAVVLAIAAIACLTYVTIALPLATLSNLITPLF